MSQQHHDWLAFIPWLAALLFLLVCVGDSFAGTWAVWGLLGWPIPLLAWGGWLLWREP